MDINKYTGHKMNMNKQIVHGDKMFMNKQNGHKWDINVKIDQLINCSRLSCNTNR